MPLPTIPLAATIGMLAASVTASAAAKDPLSSYRWSARVVVASAPSADDPSLARQRAIFKAMGQQANERDLVLVEAVGDSAKAQALRNALNIDDRGFSALLVGKDGDIKLRAAHPLDAGALFPLIDAMPMRQQEMRHRGR